jgi:Peptidase inhibitor family I36
MPEEHDPQAAEELEKPVPRIPEAYTWVGSDWNDTISSIIVVSGTWQFYTDANYGGEHSNLRVAGE